MNITKIITLGSRCNLTSALIDTQLRTESFPLDWARSFNMMSVNDAFNNDFYEFHVTKNLWNNYGVRFAHLEFYKGETPQKALIARCKKIINYLSSDHAVIFIRSTHNPTEHYDEKLPLYYNEIDHLIEFKKIIESKYPSLKYHILLINMCDCSHVKDNCEDVQSIVTSIDDYAMEPGKITIVNMKPSYYVNLDAAIVCETDASKLINKITDGKLDKIYECLMPIYDTHDNTKFTVPSDDEVLHYKTTWINHALEKCYKYYNDINIFEYIKKLTIDNANDINAYCNFICGTNDIILNPDNLPPNDVIILKNNNYVLKLLNGKINMPSIKILQDIYFNSYEGYKMNNIFRNSCIAKQLLHK